MVVLRMVMVVMVVGADGAIRTRGGKGLRKG